MRASATRSAANPATPVRATDMARFREDWQHGNNPQKREVADSDLAPAGCFEFGRRR